MVVGGLGWGDLVRFIGALSKVSSGCARNVFGGGFDFRLVPRINVVISGADRGDLLGNVGLALLLRWPHVTLDKTQSGGDAAGKKRFFGG